MNHDTGIGISESQCMNCSSGITKRELRCGNHETGTGIGELNFPYPEGDVTGGTLTSPK